MEDFGTVGRIFVHDARVAEFLDERFFSLNIRIRNIANFVGMESIPTVNLCPPTKEEADHFVPTRDLAKAMIEVGSIKLIKAYPTLHDHQSYLQGRRGGGSTCIDFENQCEDTRNHKSPNS